MTEPASAAPAPTADTAPAEGGAAPAEGAAPANGAAEAKPTNGDGLEVLNLNDLGDIADRIVEYQINGEKVPVRLSDALKQAQRYRASTQKEMRAAESVRKAEEMVQAFKEDPAKVALEAGPAAVKAAIRKLVGANDPATKAAVEEAFREMLAEAEMSPDERARKDWEAEKKAFEAERDGFRAERDKEAGSKAEKAARAHYEKAFTEALGTVGVRPTPHAVGRMAAITSAALQQGADLSAEDVAALVKEEIHGDLAAQYDGLDGEALIAALGEDRVRAIQAAAVARLKGRPPAPKAPKGAPPPAEEEAAGPQSMEDLRKKWGLKPGTF